MKIGIDARLLNQTGVGRYIQQLITNLELVDADNTYLIFLPPDIAQKIEIRNSKFTTRAIDIRWHSLKEQLFLPFILWRERLDLVHFPYFSVPILYPGKFVVTVHDLILDHFDTGQASTLPWFIYKIKRLGYKLVMWIALHRAVKIITVSHATKQEIVDHYKIKPEKVVVTYEAADNQIGTQGAKANRPLRYKRYFLYVGNAYPHKNLERLLEAFQKLLRNDNKKSPSIAFSPRFSVNLVLVGQEDYFYKRLKDKVRKMGLEKNVVFYGEATRAELNNLSKNALALVFPSLMEGFGLPGVEAMACGCLVLCSDIPIFHEILGGAAVYFNPYDINDIAAKMGLAIIYHTTEYGKYRKLQKIGLEQVKKYSWKKLAKQTLVVYQGIC